MVGLAFEPWRLSRKPTLFTSTHRFLPSPSQGDLGRPILFINLVKLGLLDREAGIYLANLWNLIRITWNFALRATEDTAL